MKKIVAAACAAAVLAASTYAVRATAGPATSTPEIATATATSKSTEFDHLARSKDPRDAMRAYMTAMLCVWPTKEMKQAELTSPGERTASQKAGLASGALKAAADRACGDLTEAQINSRRQHMEVAAEAGVPQAALYLVQEGPFGDVTALDTRPDDPAVLAWRARMVDLFKLAASKGDVMSMQSLSNMYFDGVGIVDKPDPVLALQYQTAAQLVYKAQSGRNAIPPFLRKRLTQSLTAEQIAAADAAGGLIAEVALRANKP